MFTLSKLLGFLALPSSVAILTVLLGLLLLTRSRSSRLGLRLAWVGAGALAVAGLVPVGNWLLLPLEQRYADVAPPAPGERLDGIVILGGFEDGWVTAGRGQLTVNEAAERLTEGVRLARAFPEARVLFSGGSGALWRGGVEATGPVSRYLAAMGIAETRVLVEGKSRNTHENGIYSAEIASPEPGERWALVTSAYHMPRAVGVMRKAGFSVIPVPVDYRTRGAEDAMRFFEAFPAGLVRLDLAVKEWLGLVAYRLLGRTDQLLPSP